jgi:hypothetical protein
MANVKISELPAATLPLSGTELVPLVQGSTTKRAPANAVAAATLVPRTETSNAINVTPTDTLIVLNKPAPAATVINLPTAVSRSNLPLMIADFAGNAGDITIQPAVGESIMGLAANTAWIVTSSGGPGLGGSIMLAPVTGIGWVII